MGTLDRFLFRHGIRPCTRLAFARTVLAVTEYKCTQRECAVARPAFVRD
jgi:hypothetical protein